MRALLFILTFCLCTFDAFSESKWKADIHPGIKISPPVCRGYGANISSIYKLCLPSSILKDIKVSTSGSTVIMKGPGAIQGPILIETRPPVILIGTMVIDKGALSLNITKNGGFEMKGVGGMFQLQGLIIPMSAGNPLIIEEIELEFTSPEDALLELTASGQKVGVVLRVRKNGNNSYNFIPSPPANSIFPENAFFHDFSGIQSDQKLTLIIKDGQKIDLKLAA